ncbi:MAG: asparagine--tRNA ligase [Eubacteriales bacterium]|nr:asparagine--tRNA ligase [Eubacteriales bacterium]
MIRALSVDYLYKHAQQLDGQTVTVAGWVRTIRSSSASLAFMSLSDGTCFAPVQAVLEGSRTESFADAAALNVGSAVFVDGVFTLTPDAPQPFEIQAHRVRVEGESQPDYPLQKKRHSLEYLRTLAHLRPRTNTFQAVFRLRSLLAKSIHDFFQERGFVYVHTPLITTSDCEGAGEMFRVSTLDAKNPPLTAQGGVDFSQDFFGKEAFLTVSGQLDVESHAMAFRNVYTFGPTFRAEKSFTPRHAAEFWMIEPEIAFADLEDDMALAEDMMKYMISDMLAKAPEELKFFNQFIDKGLIQRLEHVAGADFARVSYTEAIDILKKSGKSFEYPVGWELGLQTEHERYLTEEVFRRPVFVTDYPKEVKAFYMRLNDDERTVAATDLLVPGIGEIIGGSQREERMDVLLSRMAECGLDEAPYWWYLDLRRYGSVRHAGYGLGFERAVMYLTGMKNIRDVISFPRTTGSADF